MPGFLLWIGGSEDEQKNDQDENESAQSDVHVNPSFQTESAYLPRWGAT